MGMKNQNEKIRFGSSCISSILLCLVFLSSALLIYYFIPEDTGIPSEPQDIAALEVESLKEAAPFEEELALTEEFDDFLTEVSFAAFNRTSDKGLVLYRQSMSKAAVERFYTRITGDRDVAKAILSEAERNDIPLSLAFALAYTESHYKITAVNHNTNQTIDRGLFQLNSSSFPNLTEADFFDPFTSAKYGMSHLKHCLKMSGNEVSALAMYNAGSGSVRSNRTPQSTLNYIGKIISYQKKLDDMFVQEVVSFYETQIVPGITPAFAEKMNDW